MADNLFDSDSIRHARPLRHLQTATFDDSFALELGGTLPSVTVAFETYGRLNAARDNAVLICHAISGDSHVAGHNAEDDPGWWDIVVGPGKPIDTDRYFVICPNLLGGCRGTTGPGSINPSTGKPWGNDFPAITVGDMVEVERRLLDRLGVKKLLAMVGGSLGGHQALAWAARYPDQARGVIALATSARLTSQALAFDVVGRNAIRSDPHFHGGQYYGEEHGPELGLAIARMIGHITYLSREAMTQKFEADRLEPREVVTEFEKTFSVGSYLGYQGSKFVERFDANSYIVLSTAMDLFDLGGTPAELAARFRDTRSRWLVISFTSDWLFPPDQSQDLVRALLANNAPVSYCNVRSDCGHDAFFLPNELDSYGEMIRGFLGNLSGAGPIAAESEDRDDYSPTSLFHPQRHRLDYDRIIELIPPGASVLDLGCGSGGLLARIKEANRHRLVGVELDEHAVVSGIHRGLDIVQADLNKGLGLFADHQFDWIVLSQTLQAVRDVDGVIAEILRVGRQCIVSFPNLAFHRLRRILADEGRAPRAYGWMRDKWYDTPDIRFLSISDFESFCREKDIHIHSCIALDTEAGKEVTRDPNLNADLAVMVISRPNR
ncbi:MAG TPA: homoserine O-acetyltransferase [Candidatus Binataceae bacterium]|nr:homoserine O-acetyltransferase [Candidatus Binataceae bacterium]